jgi:hypothetical protein
MSGSDVSEVGRFISLAQALAPSATSVFTQADLQEKILFTHADWFPQFKLAAFPIVLLDTEPNESASFAVLEDPQQKMGIAMNPAYYDALTEQGLHSHSSDVYFDTPPLGMLRVTLDPILHIVHVTFVPPPPPQPLELVGSAGPIHD